MALLTKPAERCGAPTGSRRRMARRATATVSISVLFCLAAAAISAPSQQPAATQESGTGVSATANPPQSVAPQSVAPNDSVLALAGLPVVHISFEGVSADRLAPLPGHLPQLEGAPLTADNLKKSLRQLYATGLYDTVEIQGSRPAGGVALVFVGTPRTFIGIVSVDGAV